MASNKTYVLMVAAIISACVSSYFVLGLLTSKTVTSTGSLVGADIEFYRDSACTKILDALDWGEIKVEGEYTQTLYLKNVGSIPMSLYLNISDYVPPGMKNLMSLQWDLEGATLEVGEVSPATFTYTLYDSIRGIDQIDYNITIQCEK